jgi:hypothetical protein
MDRLPVDCCHGAPSTLFDEGEGWQSVVLVKTKNRKATCNIEDLKVSRNIFFSVVRERNDGIKKDKAIETFSAIV